MISYRLEAGNCCRQGILPSTGFSSPQLLTNHTNLLCGLLFFNVARSVRDHTGIQQVTGCLLGSWLTRQHLGRHRPQAQAGIPTHHRATHRFVTNLDSG